jgi:hypothetical protein
MAMPQVLPEAGRPLALIVASDHAELRRMMIQARAEGWSVLGAPDSQEACALLESFDPGLIIADVDLPGMSLVATRARKISARFAALRREGAAEALPFWDAELRKPVDRAELSALLAEGRRQ